MSSTPRSSQSSDAATPAMAMKVPFAAQERAKGHFQRAQDQFKMKRYNEAVAELRDAIKNDPTQSEYHAWMAKVQLQKGLVGMAAISIRQALQLDENDALALECQKQIDTLNAQKQPPKTDKPGLGGLLSRKLF